MLAQQKVTVHLPRALLLKAQESTGQGITETIRQGLELVAARQAYASLRSLRGKVTLALDVTALRDDR